jgi:Zn ribbon nucleic-acid-binding protein
MESVVFCSKCGSSQVDIKCWTDEHTAIFRCSNCGNETQVQGFTLGKADVGEKAMAEALQSMAIYNKYDGGMELWIRSIKRRAMERGKDNG